MTHRGVILVVDDDRATCRFVSKVLGQHDFEVHTAVDADQALSLVAEYQFDMALLDFRLPDLDGAELCRKIQDRQTELPAVFLTGYPTIDTVFPAVDAGAERILAKPIGVDELVAVVETTLGIGRREGKAEA